MKRDKLFDDAAHLIFMHQNSTISFIQRKFSISYSRADHIMDQLEAAGIVGPYEGSMGRQILFDDKDSLEQFLSTL